MSQLVRDTSGLSIPTHDYLEFTYVSSGNGEGEINTITYKTGGSSGTTVAVVTMAYNSDDKLTSLTLV